MNPALALLIGTAVFVVLFLGLLVWCLGRVAAMPSPQPERLVIHRRLQFDEPRHHSHALVPPITEPEPVETAPDPDTVRQIMRQLGRRDAAGREMAERILAQATTRSV